MPPAAGSRPVTIELNAVLVALIGERAAGADPARTARCCRPVRSRSSIPRCRRGCAPGSSARPIIRWAMSSSSTPSPTAIAPKPRTGRRVVSISYLGLTRERAAGGAARAGLAELVSLLPLGGLARRPAAACRRTRSCRRSGAGQRGARRRAPARTAPARRGRLSARVPWNEELVLQRYELLYEAGLVPEARTAKRPCRRRPASCSAMPMALRPSPHPRHRHRAPARQDQVPAGRVRADAARLHAAAAPAHRRGAGRASPAQAELPPPGRAAGPGRGDRRDRRPTPAAGPPSSSASAARSCSSAPSPAPSLPLARSCLTALIALSHMITRLDASVMLSV